MQNAFLTIVDEYFWMAYLRKKLMIYKKFFQMVNCHYKIEKKITLYRDKCSIFSYTLKIRFFHLLYFIYLAPQISHLFECDKNINNLTNGLRLHTPQQTETDCKWMEYKNIFTVVDKNLREAFESGKICCVLKYIFRVWFAIFNAVNFSSRAFQLQIYFYISK